MRKYGVHAMLVNSATGDEYPLYTQKASIGRSENNEIVIRDPAMSRQHAVITEENGRFYITDCGSSNGVAVNGQRIPAGQRFPIQPGLEFVLAKRVPVVLRAEQEEKPAAANGPEAGTMVLRDDWDEGTSVMRGGEWDEGTSVMRGGDWDEGTSVMRENDWDEGTSVMRGGEADEGTSVMGSDDWDEGTSVMRGGEADEGTSVMGDDWDEGTSVMGSDDWDEGTSVMRGNDWDDGMGILSESEWNEDTSVLKENQQEAQNGANRNGAGQTGPAREVKNTGAADRRAAVRTAPSKGPGVFAKVMVFVVAALIMTIVTVTLGGFIGPIAIVVLWLIFMGAATIIFLAMNGTLGGRP